MDNLPATGRCRGGSRDYRLQVGFSDGTTAEITGRTDPTCVGQILQGSSLTGPPGLGVYGVVMKAFGQQYADKFDPAASNEPLRCPKNPRNPDSSNLDGASAHLDTGYLYGEREPMTMPLTAVRGIVCTWQIKGSDPVIRDLTPQAAEQVRIGLHAIFGAMVDCSGSADPTYTAVVEDKTGTRRAVTIVESECSTVIRSDGGFGLGFAWLDR